MNSLDLKANEFIVHIRSDAQIDKLAVVKALNRRDGAVAACAQRGPYQMKDPGLGMHRVICL